jgi:pyruvate, water dikinase
LSYVRFLDELAAADLPLAGGKGANLGELVRGKFPVPRGFVITTDAFHLAALSATVSGPERHDSSEQRIGGVQLAPPPDVAIEVVGAYQSLSAPTVAVRSSATAEDLPNASFAGQQETFLHVTGEEDLLASVSKCWRSLWSERAIRYRVERGIPDDSLGMAVVVQEMAPHEAAGVVFTVNPVSRRGDEMLINGAQGVGEAVVGGTLVPDQWIVGRPGGAVIDFVPGRYSESSRVRANPLLRRKVIGCLSSLHVTELARLALRVEDHFMGVPQDVEWSYGEARFHLLQARPITAPIKPSSTA